MCCIQIAGKNGTLRCVVLKVAHRNMLKIAHHFSLCRQAKKTQLPLVFIIERYEKRYAFVHHYGCVKLTMLIDAPATIQNCGVVYSISTN